MNTGLLHLHNILRWVILILLLLAIVKSFSAKSNPDGSIKKISLFLLISAHIQFVIGIYQWFTGSFGYKLIKANGFGEVMNSDPQRFWAVEHITGTLIAIILITIARGKVKKQQFGKASWLYIIALLLILAVVPWPFRDVVARPWFPGMH